MDGSLGLPGCVYIGTNGLYLSRLPMVFTTKGTLLCQGSGGQAEEHEGTAMTRRSINQRRSDSALSVILYTDLFGRFIFLRRPV